MQKKLAILGSTGSIGTQTLEIVAKNPQYFKAEVLTANNNVDLLIEQAKRFFPEIIVVGNVEKYSFVKEALQKYPIEILTGAKGISASVCNEGIDLVVAAMVGYAGLHPVIEAIKCKKNIALANKETLVIAGDLIINLCKKNKTSLIPIDSEHSAILQCIAGEDNNTIEKIFLTASGGPFRNKNRQFLEKVTPKQALKHPNWEMGAKITIDSASLMNKGFEIIEAKWLFELKPEQIEVIVHPQSIIHSMVQFCDGSIKAQMGLPDMKIPIQYALGFPKRMASDFPRFSFADFPSLNFEQPDTENFPNLQLAYKAMSKGGNLPCILNASNEVVVRAFLQEKIRFTQMPEIIEKCFRKIHFIAHPTYEDYVVTHNETEQLACSLSKLSYF